MGVPKAPIFFESSYWLVLEYRSFVKDIQVRAFSSLRKPDNRIKIAPIGWIRINRKNLDIASAQSEFAQFIHTDSYTPC